MKKEILLGLMVLGLLGCTQGNSMELKGRIAMKGFSQHTYLTIYDKSSKQSYKIQNKEKFDLMKRQNQTVTLKARLIKKAVGPGFPAVIEVVEVK